MFDANFIANSDRAEEALMNAVQFELLWLENKRDYYGAIHTEDAKRIDMLANRLALMKNGN